MVYHTPAACPRSGLCVRDDGDLQWSFMNTSEEGGEILGQ